MICRNALTLGRVELCGTAENMRLSPGILLVFLTLVDSDSSPGKGLRRLNLPTQHHSLFLTLSKQAPHLPSMPCAGTVYTLCPKARGLSPVGGGNIFPKAKYM